jgi:hypothetical protein
MGSRDKNGERLRSNRLRKGAHVNDTAPNADDKATIYFTIVGGDPENLDPAKRPGLVFHNGEQGVIPPRVYQHPGGMQLIGNILAIAVETPRQFGLDEGICNSCLSNSSSFSCPLSIINTCVNYERALDPTIVMFFDVTDPEAPVFISQFAPKDNNGNPLTKAGVVGVTPLRDGAYLMAVTGGANDPLFFYRTKKNIINLQSQESTYPVLSSPNLRWEYMGKTAGPNVEDPHQTLQFIREGNIEGALYLAGARGSAIFGDRDRIDLYQVICNTPECMSNEEIKLTVRYNGQRITPFPSTGGIQLFNNGSSQLFRVVELANLAAASGFHITPSGELLLYATEHDNDGPNGSIKAGEWRHREIVRQNSPTLLPTARVNGPYEVDEGSIVNISGSAAPPITKAFIQLYHNTGYESLYPVVDFADRYLDDFDDFSILESFPNVTSPVQNVTHNDKAQSWNWFAPVGCSIKAIDNYQGSVDETRTLPGTGTIQRASNLSLVLNDGGTDNINQEVDAIDFLGNCDNYYATPFRLRWDLDINGSYETAGNSVQFNATAFDGPSLINVPAQAQHPAGGPTSQTSTATVTIRNIAPQITQFQVADSSGRLLNTNVPFVLTGMPVTVSANFTDPGVLDHQTATLGWGDGSVQPQTAFTTFNEAFGDGTGTVLHTHRYNVSGTYQIALSVKDDDGGMNTATNAIVRVVTPAQAVKEIISLLDTAIATTTNQKVRNSLDKARKALAGSNDNSNNGALNKILAGNKQAALVFLRQAIDELRQSQTGGADVSTLIFLLEQTAVALSAN